MSGQAVRITVALPEAGHDVGDIVGALRKAQWHTRFSLTAAEDSLRWTERGARVFTTRYDVGFRVVAMAQGVWRAEA